MKKTVLMDLQGTLGGDPIGDITSFDFYPRALDALKLLFERDFRLVVVTNQSRISKGFLSEAMYKEKVAELIEIAKENGVNDIEFYCCPHTKADKCKCKKPHTELFQRANLKEPIDRANCFMIGDMGMSDMLFAHNLGIRKILVLTGVGEGSLNAYRSTWAEAEPDFIAGDIFDAALWIVKG